MIEIERKFLIKSEVFKKEAISKSYIVQGFLNSDPERTIRIRLKDGKGYLTVKGKSSEDGTTRFEWETEISEKEAKALFQLCEKGMIEKYRFKVLYEGNLFEIDEFLGDNKGLTIAEIELKEKSTIFKKPLWLGEEITGEINYYNSQLSKNPFKNW